MIYKKSICLSLLILIGGCESIPSFNQCPSPKFITDNTTTVDKYFFTEDLLAKFCPAETPKTFSYQVTPNAALSIHLKGEWVYLKANDGLKRLDLYVPKARIANFKNYTHVIPLDALESNELVVTIDNHIEYKAKFTVINCTCIK
ncbi:hypothetical protein ACVBE9_06820 [Eionea flava]